MRFFLFATVLLVSQLHSCQGELASLKLSDLAKMDITASKYIQQTRNNLSAADSIRTFCEDEKDAELRAMRESCTQQPINLVLLVDSTHYAGPEDFEKLKETMSQVAQQFKLGPEETRVSIAQYAHYLKSVLDFNDGDSPQAVQDTISSLKQMVEIVDPLPGIALSQVPLILLDANNKGYREELPTVVVLFSFRRNIQQNNKYFANALRRSHPNLRILAVAVEPEEERYIDGRTMAEVYKFGGRPKRTVLKTAELVELAGGSEGVFLSCGFGRLGPSLVNALSDSVCRNLDTRCGNSPMDVVFLVERPGDAGSENLKHIKGFLRSFADGLSLGPSRIALVQFTDKVRTEFPLTDNAQAVNDAINSLSMMAPPATAGYAYADAAVHFVHREFFGYGKEKRDGVDPVIVVISTGEFIDNPIGGVSTTTNAGVTVLAVGIGQNAKEDLFTPNLPGRRVSIDSFSQLDRTCRDRLNAILCEDKPQMKLTGNGRLEYLGCREHGASYSAFLKTQAKVDYTKNGPLYCLRRCRAEGKPTGVIALYNYHHCYCGAAELAESLPNAPSEAYCVAPCLPASANPFALKCGGGAGWSLYRDTAE